MSPAELTNLLRLAADGELNPEQELSLEAHLAANPEDREFIEFEQRLRAAVGRVMGDAQAPQTLRAQVQAALHESTPALRLSPAAASTPTRAPRRVFAPSGLAAGFLLLVGAAVVIGVMGRSDWFDWLRATQIPVSDHSGAIGFPIQEHQRCLTDQSYAQRKFTIHTQAALRDYLHNTLAWDVTLPDLADFGFSFVDAGDCSTGTGSVQSIHLRYGDGSTMLSVWIERSLPSELTHSARLEEGQAYFVTPTNRQSVKDESLAYYAWRAGEFVYRVVPASAEDADRIAISVGMPAVTPQEFN